MQTNFACRLFRYIKYLAFMSSGIHFCGYRNKYKIGKRGRSSNDIYVKTKSKNVKADEFCRRGCGRRLLFFACYVIMKKKIG